MRAELFVAFFHSCSCSTLISPPPVDFRNVPFRMTLEMWIFVVKQVSVRVSYRHAVAVMYSTVRSTLLHTGCFPQRALSRDVNMRPVRFPLHLWSTAQVASGPICQCETRGAPQ